MRNSELKKTMNTAGRLLLAWVLVVSQCVWAQNASTSSQAQKASTSTASKTPDPPAKAQNQEEESAPQAAGETNSKGGPSVGIKVHGHWTIDVRNPDGTLVTHREFENSLIPGSGFGAGALATFLARQYLVGA